MCILLGRVSLTFIRFSDGVKAIRNTFCPRAYHPRRPRTDSGVAEAANTSANKGQPDNTVSEGNLGETGVSCIMCTPNT